MGGWLGVAADAFVLGGAGGAAGGLLSVFVVPGLVGVAAGTGCATAVGGASVAGAGLVGAALDDCGCGWTQPHTVTVAERVTMSSPRINCFVQVICQRPL